MCGIAGMIDLAEAKSIDQDQLGRMAGAMFHRGPDEGGLFLEPGVGLVSRRLSIVGLSNGRQPIYNEDRTVAVVFNGEFFDFPEKRKFLEEKGHHFQTECDTEILVHLWEEYGEEMLPKLRGQFAFCLYDMKKRQFIMGRDRIGICPLHYIQQGERLYFASEIKSILATGEVKAKLDPRGMDHIFTFFALPSRRTMFEGIKAVAPGHYLKIQMSSSGQLAQVEEHRYWDFDFPDDGEESKASGKELLEGFREKFDRGVEIRLRADVPVVSYLSGGVDSATVAAAASRLRKDPIPTFTVKIVDPQFDESEKALLNAKAIGCNPTIVACDAEKLSNTYPKLVRAADSPVIDTACAALYLLAEEVHRQNYKVALTGEGADEALAGYPWFKTFRLINMFKLGPLDMRNFIRRATLWVTGLPISWDRFKSIIQSNANLPLAPADMYALFSSSRQFFYSNDIKKELNDFNAFDELPLSRDNMKRWHPLNQSLYLGYKTILPGLLMNHKGDRVAMAHSVETRYPFLDEDFIDYCAQLPPSWKLRGLYWDKYILRQMGEGVLPREITRRPKAMFRAPFKDTFFTKPPKYVEDLLSRKSLEATGLFDADRVEKFRHASKWTYWRPGQRLFLEMGLTGVLATQLWHHLYVSGDLCELEPWSNAEVPNLSEEMVVQ